MPYKNLAAYKAKAFYFEFAEHQIAYWHNFSEENRDNETILFIHGFPSAAWDWHYMWEALKSKYRLLAFDLLGFGLSDKPCPYQYKLNQQADIAEHLLSLMEVKHCHILAHDYGDSVAQAILSRSYLNRFTSTINSMCFLNGGLFAESHRPLLTQKLLKSKLGPFIAQFMSQKSLQKGFTKIFGKSTPPTSDEIDVLWELLEHNGGKACLHYLLRYIEERYEFRDSWVEAMQSTHVPLYFVNGVQDPISGQHMLEQYRHLIPNAHCIGIDVGHYPQLEAPQKVISLYTDFLQVNKLHI